jgi:hypothetical protein
LLLISENADFETHGVAHLRWFPWNYWENGDTLPRMRKSDVMCPECSAGYRRIELATPGKQGEFRCLVCDHLLEVFDGSREIALRLTVQPAKYRNGFQADEWRPVARGRKPNP